VPHFATLKQRTAFHATCNIALCWPSLVYNYYFRNCYWWSALSHIKFHSLFWLWILCACVRACLRARAVCSATWLYDLRKMAMRVIIFRKATWNENRKQLSCLQVRRKVNKYVFMSVNRTSLIVLDIAIANTQWDAFENKTDGDIPFLPIIAREFRRDSHYLFDNAAWHVYPHVSRIDQHKGLTKISWPKIWDCKQKFLASWFRHYSLVEWNTETDMVFCLLRSASRSTALKVSKHSFRYYRLIQLERSYRKIIWRQEIKKHRVTQHTYDCLGIVLVDARIRG